MAEFVACTSSGEIGSRAMNGWARDRLALLARISDASFILVRESKLARLYRTSVLIVVA
jgi:hypothetical protein